MNPLHIRARDNGDLPGCVAALAEVHAADGYPTRWPAEPAGWLTPTDLLHAWTAHLDDTVVGHVVIRGVADDSMASLLAASGGVPPERLASLSRLFVVPGARRRGVASGLIGRATCEAATDGLRLVLDVVDDGRGAAVALYEEAGWRRVASVQAAWTMPDGRRPMVSYYLSPQR
ncbi:GNAT family N-acetyltransferase [Actinopolymorpha pittospori]|uniref:GNAT superfamily N-acetyltransferase n=1 Tax=Actinopolymorpha pittospori TaxID=648752 RepID=A0A927N034_9ACTN|nr:GNAT family N-acetyltransferase [Actinopolymorpha pittospori]MBE1609337.1 GNAT superfamily N-acetyltransferase [Actinopolymorpha pittospori]